MQAQRTKITLAAPLQLSSTDQLAQIRAGFAAQFPLRNLHWKPATRTSIRTIQTLEVDVLTLESVKEECATQIPSSLLDRPFLNVYVVVCEDNDTYKITVKKQIKDWHTQVCSRKSQEWLILLVSKSDARQNQSGLLKMRGTVLDRIRADFNVDKKDRCAQLIWTTDFKKATVWAEIISKVKDGIIAAFDQAVSQREDEIRRSELQKTMPGWNFCTFFILKESLARSFEGANLLEDALIQYEELEASFYQVLKDKTLWFGNFVEPSPKDDSLPLLSLTKKPYRDLIIANTISVFDIRVYLLAQQSNLLGQMGRVTEIARKVVIFLAAFSSRLQEFKNILPDGFIESWSYSSALSAVEACDEWARGRELDTASLISFNAAKGELLTLARNQLDKIGIRLGYLPNEPVFSACVVDPAELGTSDTPGSSSKPTRRKFALKLHGSLAALDLHRERYTNAFQTYTSLPAHYAPHRWSSLESYMLFQSIETHSRMQNAHDRQWIYTAVAFIKTYVEDDALEMLYGVHDKSTYIKRLLEAVVNAASQMDVDLPFQEQPILSIQPLTDSARCAEEQDGYFLDVTVKNKLPCAFALDKITLTLTGRATETMEFTSSSIVAKPGVSTVALFCPLPMDGLYLAGRVEARLGHLLLQWSFAGKQKRRRSLATIDKSFPKLVKLPYDPRTVRVEVERPLDVELTGPSRISVTLASGRNLLSRASLKISSPDVSIHNKEGTASGTDSPVSFDTSGVSLTNMPAGQIVRFGVPHSSASGVDVIKVLVELEYVTAEEPEILRKMNLTRFIETSLALTVNVQDFFCGEKLLTNFIISSTTHQHIRILSVELRPSNSDQNTITIIEHGKSKGPITVTPAQPANFIFQLSVQGEVNDSLRLYINYRPLREEVEDLVKRRIDNMLPGLSEWKERTEIREAVIGALEGDPSWIEMYEVTGEVHVPDTDAGASKELITRLKQILRDDPISSEDGGDWRRLSIPVDLPHIDILATARIDIVANPFDTDKPITRHDGPPIYTGQPITAIISINTSFYWASHDKESEEYRMRFELEDNIKDWLISGQKRGDFLARNGSTHKVSITLMALRHGEIPLPSVRITALPQKREGTQATPPSLETYQVHGAERLLVLPRGGRTTFILNVGREQ